MFLLHHHYQMITNNNNVNLTTFIIKIKVSIISDNKSYEITIINNNKLVLIVIYYPEVNDSIFIFTSKKIILIVDCNYLVKYTFI